MGAASKIQGGAQLQEKKRTTEETEPLNLRTADPLDSVIAEMIGRPTGGYVSQKDFAIPHPLMATPKYVSFDRAYMQFKLLIDFYPSTFKYSTQKEETENEIAEKRKYAESIGMKYLPIFDGQIYPEELQQAIGNV